MFRGVSAVSPRNLEDYHESMKQMMIHCVSSEDYKLLLENPICATSKLQTRKLHVEIAENMLKRMGYC